MTVKSEKIGFGGGCHWCTEAVFQALIGVRNVEQGFIQSDPPNDTYSEAVIVNFDPKEIDLATLIEIHVRTHASTSRHKMRDKYRSAAYTFIEEQYERAQSELDHLRPQFDMPIITEVLRFAGFKPSDKRFRNYYRNNSAKPFCEAYIDPKLKLLRERFARAVRATD